MRGIAAEAGFLRADEDHASIGPEKGQISLDERGALGRGEMLQHVGGEE